MRSIGKYLSTSKAFEISNAYLDSFRHLTAEFSWVSAFVAIGVVLRVSGFTVGSIWFDEMFSLQMSRQGFWEMIQALKENISPPGFEILLWFTTRLFGWNEFSLRILSVVASILTLFILWKIVKAIHLSPSQQIASLAIVAMLPYQLSTAQHGRVYAIFTLLFLVGFYAALMGRWYLLGISISGLLWSHNISFMYIPGLLLIGLQVHPRSWKKILLSAFLAGITYLPWIGSTIHQVGFAMPWFSPLTFEGFLDSFRISLFGYDVISGIGGLIWLTILYICALTIPWMDWILNRMRKDCELGPKRLLKNILSEYLNIRDLGLGSFSSNRIRILLFNSL